MTKILLLIHIGTIRHQIACMLHCIGNNHDKGPLPAVTTL